MNTRSLLERRAGIVAEMRTLTANDGDLGDEQRARFDTLKAEADALQARIDRQAVVDDLERRQAGTPITGTGDGNLDRELRSFSVVRAIASQVPGITVDAGRERELSAEVARRSGRSLEGMAVPLAALTAPLERRTQVAGDDTAGGYLVGTDHRADQYIDLLRNALVVRGLGARVLSGLRGNIEIPRKTGTSTAAWIGENQSLDFSDSSFGKLNLSPRTAGGLTEISRNLLMQSSPDIEQLVRADLAAVLAEALDRAALTGNGTLEPLGILTDTTVPEYHVTGADGAALSTDVTGDMIGTIDAANAMGGATAFVSNSKQRTKALKAKDGEGRLMGLANVFHGERTAFTNLVPSNYTKGSGTGLSALIYGDWSQLILAYWGELQLLVNPFAESSYRKGAVQVRAMVSCDIALRHVESFVVTKELTAP